MTSAPPPAAKSRSPAPVGVAGNPARFAGAYEEESVVRQKASDAPATHIGRGRVEEQSTDDLIAGLFESAQAVYEQPDLTGAAYLLLDLAMQAVPSDSGAVFIADINRQDLFFAAARGPKGQEAMKFRVPMGQGIVGFSAQAGVSLAVSDVQRDPRFYARIAQSLGYETRSILCSPAQKEGRVFGALELINKKNGTSYTSEEVSLLNYLAHELAEYLVSTGQAGA
ncbi:MAG: GAF domain-containing protein [Deltaproteobacteria bacterium]|nr:GAF domain-containing protein [Deltaproteobacteria bacterium]